MYIYVKFTLPVIFYEHRKDTTNTFMSDNFASLNMGVPVIRLFIYPWRSLFFLFLQETCQCNILILNFTFIADTSGYVQLTNLPNRRVTETDPHHFRAFPRLALASPLSMTKTLFITHMPSDSSSENSEYASFPQKPYAQQKHFSERQMQKLWYWTWLYETEIPFQQQHCSMNKPNLWLALPRSYG